MKKFSECKLDFDRIYDHQSTFVSIAPVHLTLNKTCVIKNEKGQKNEQYYKWQLIYALVNSGLYNRDYIGTEISFPKGNKQSNPRETISWTNESHIKILSSIVEHFQNYSFIRSHNTDLYQIVFYQFANEFSKAEKGQFLTPMA